MVYDGHIHISEGPQDRDDFKRRLQKADVAGAIVISLPPASFAELARPRSNAKRLESLFYWVDGHSDLYPFYWIDPLEADADEQVTTAVAQGVSGFKVICNRFYPRDPQAISLFKLIAQSAKPILFHSGILWDAHDSARFNRPGEFEALLEVEGLRFSLAHLSWPWCDELVAVYGKFLNAHVRRPELTNEMFVDTTPGTPVIYRKDALTKFFCSDYDASNNVIFGTDCRVNDYNVEWARQWLERDRQILGDLQLDPAALERVFAHNLRRFVGLTKEEVSHQLPRAGE